LFFVATPRKTNTQNNFRISSKSLIDLERKERELMLETLRKDPQTIVNLDWASFAPHYQRLQAQELRQENVQAWLEEWSDLMRIGSELYSRLYVAVSVNTADQAAEERFKAFWDGIYPMMQEAEQGLKQKFLEGGFEPAGYSIPLRDLRAQADLFSQDNLPIQAEESKLKIEYDKILGAQTVVWEGNELTVSQITPIFQSTDRSRREEAWRLVRKRQLADRDAINQVWQKLLGLRCKLAENKGMADYRAYRWQELLRFDYTPADAHSFHEAIEKVVVPAALRIYKRRQERLGLYTLRPWDLDVDVFGLPALRPFEQIEDLKSGVSRIFDKVDPALGAFFDQMEAEDLLDIENRKNKAPGAYCIDFPVVERPFIFGNSVGLHNDVQTLLHESGHAFHSFASLNLSSHFRNVPIEFAEVASMSMELLASPYLTAAEGGFYSPSEAARARIEHLEGCICFWPYMVVVDAFQHWVYANPDRAADPAQCDDAWARLWQRFMVGVDWNGLDDEMATGWQRKQHIHTDPFYYIEYGLAQLGAVQVWGNSQKNQSEAVAAYRRALELGGKVSLPELFKTAGARFAFDANVLSDAVSLIEETIHHLEAVLGQ
jgi:oligoendopeptidase F